MISHRAEVDRHVQWLRQHGEEDVARAIEGLMGTKRSDLVENLGSIVVGMDYVYTADIPKDCKGYLYHAHRFIQDVPSYQRKVLVECLNGPDQGLWFCCSEWNFSTRYRLANTVESEQVPQRMR